MCRTPASVPASSPAPAAAIRPAKSRACGATYAGKNISVEDPLGASVVSRTLSRAQKDGSDRAPSEPVAPAPSPGKWSPTAPGFEPFLEPHWGDVATMVVDGPVLPADVPAWDSPEMAAQRADFDDVQGRLTDNMRAVAKQWAGGPGTDTPGGTWVRRAAQMADKAGVDALSATGLLAATSAAVHDAFVSCWAGKSTFNLARPQNWKNETDPQWRPMLDTPPFPSYTSGHATVSGAASEVLAAAFPERTRVLRNDAAEAARSRVYGGIHWRVDGSAGLAAGREIGREVARELGIAPMEGASDVS